MGSVLFRDAVWRAWYAKAKSTGEPSNKLFELAGVVRVSALVHHPSIPQTKIFV